MNAAKTGFIAEFVTGYLQREIRVKATVVGGTDVGMRDANIGAAAIAALDAKRKGFAPGRLVVYDAATGAITAATNVTATSIGNATHIIAQSDDTIRELPEDYNYWTQSAASDSTTDSPKVYCVTRNESATGSGDDVVYASSISRFRTEVCSCRYGIYFKEHSCVRAC